MKLHIEDLQVTRSSRGGRRGRRVPGRRLATCRIGCQSGGGGQMCVTYQYETCETGPVYYC